MSKNLFSFFLLVVVFVSSAASAKKTVLYKPKPGTVALTFDDGSSPGFTPQVLKILSRYNVHATFFISASLAKKYPAIIKDILARGNRIASHGINHKNLRRASLR